MRLVTTVHGWVHRTPTHSPLLLRRSAFIALYEKVICVSDDLVRACRKAGVPASRCMLLENGIDVAAFRRRCTPTKARAKLGFLNVPTIGALGRLSAEKGFDILIRAVDQLLTKGLQVQLLIAGEGAEQNSLAELIRELGRDNSIRLLGYRTDLVPLYESMDVYALSSYREGLPNVLLEAMAMEVPVVATRIAGVPRLVTSGESGELADAGSVHQLAAALERLLRDADLRKALRCRGQTSRGRAI